MLAVWQPYSRCARALSPLPGVWSTLHECLSLSHHTMSTLLRYITTSLSYRNALSMYLVHFVDIGDTARARVLLPRVVLIAPLYISTTYAPAAACSVTGESCRDADNHAHVGYNVHANLCVHCITGIAMQRVVVHTTDRSPPARCATRV